MHLTTVARCAAVFLGWMLLSGTAVAQNDWQFPDPYFGAIEFGKSHPPAAERDTRRQASPPPSAWIPSKRPRLLRSFRTRSQPLPPPRPPRDANTP